MQGCIVELLRLVISEAMRLSILFCSAFSFKQSCPVHLTAILTDYFIYQMHHLHCKLRIIYCRLCTYVMDIRF